MIDWNRAKQGLMPRNATSASILLLYIFAAALICAVTMPPIMDFPNHLARLWLLGGGIEQGRLRDFYNVQWSQASTNVLVDYVAASLVRVMPIMLVSRLLLLVIFLGPPLGALLLARRVFGRVGSWGATFILFAWTTTSVAGFMSYQIAITGALLGAAAMYRMIGERHLVRLFTTHLVISAVLLAIHPFGLLFYLALFCGLALGPAPWQAVASNTLRAAALIVPAAVVSILLVFALLRLAPSPPGNVGHVFWWDRGLLIGTRNLLSAILSYSKPVDAAFAGMLVIVIVVLASTRRLRVHGGLLLVAFVLIPLVMIAPSAIGDASWLERRLPLMLALTGLVSLQPVMRSCGEARIVAGVLVGLAALRLMWVGAIWLERDKDARAVIDAGRVIPSGSAVLLLRAPSKWEGVPPGRIVVGDPYIAEPTSRHLGALLVITRQVFVPTLFSIPGQHPLRVTPAWASRAVTSSGVASPSDLVAPPKEEPYLHDWRCRFDYVVVTDQDQSNRQHIDVRDAVPLLRGRYVDVSRIVKPSNCAIRR